MLKVVVAKLSLWETIVVVIEVRLAGCRRERKDRCVYAAVAGTGSMTLIRSAKENLGRMLFLVAVELLRPKMLSQ